MTYSIDLRERTVKYVEEGHSVREASSIFGVSIRIIWTWIRRKKEGKLPPEKRKRSPRKIKNELLIEFIESNPDAYLREIADHFGVTLQAIFYACKRLKITLKKRARSTKNEMNRSAKNI